MLSESFPKKKEIEQANALAKLLHEERTATVWHAEAKVATEEG